MNINFGSYVSSEYIHLMTVAFR